MKDFLSKATFGFVMAQLAPGALSLLAAGVAFTAVSRPSIGSMRELVFFCLDGAFRKRWCWRCCGRAGPGIRDAPSWTQLGYARWVYLRCTIRVPSQPRGICGPLAFKCYLRLGRFCTSGSSRSCAPAKRDMLESRRMWSGSARTSSRSFSSFRTSTCTSRSSSSIRRMPSSSAWLHRSWSSSCAERRSGALALP